MKQQLTERQRRFVEAYAASGNGGHSARAAGYSVKGADVTASQLLRNPKVVAAIAALAEPKRHAAIADREERQRFWSDVFRGKENEMRDRLKASELLGKSGGDFLERHEIVSGSLIDVFVYVPNNEREVR